MEIHATTILAVRKDGHVAMAGDGQVTMNNTVLKSNARKIRTIYNGKVLCGFAGATADAFTLFEHFEAKVQEDGGDLTRASVELAKDWRTDRGQKPMRPATQPLAKTLVGTERLGGLFFDQFRCRIERCLAPVRHPKRRLRPCRHH